MLNVLKEPCLKRATRDREVKEERRQKQGKNFERYILSLTVEE